MRQVDWLKGPYSIVTKFESQKDLQLIPGDVSNPLRPFCNELISQVPSPSCNELKMGA